MAVADSGMPKKLFWVINALFFLIAPIFSGAAPVLPHRSAEKPLEIIRAYLKAIHARDFQTAYRYISTTDKRVRDEITYLGSEANLSGFALELAKKLADEMEVWAVAEKLGVSKARYEVGYRVPTADELAAQLHHWNPDKLNALSPGEQHRLREAVGGIKSRGPTISIEGRESFELVLERDGWKLYLDWPSRTRVVFKARPSRIGYLEVQFLRNDLLVKIDDPFQMDFTVKNLTDRDLTVRVDHRFEPRQFAEYVDMIACGFLAPFRLASREKLAISSNYLLRRPLPKSSLLSIIYNFSDQPAAVKKNNAL
jgi:hypothetical protein